MGTLYERIQTLCKNKGVSGSRMCLDLGMSKSTLSDMKNGRTKGLSVPNAQKIAGYFGITVDELYGNSAKKDQTTNGDLENKNSPSELSLTEGEKLMLELFRQIPEDRQSEALDLLRVALKMQQRS